MATIEWDERLNVGHSMIERNHQKLVGLINELGEAMSNGYGKTVCGRILDDLARYAEMHFAVEDQLMTVHRYPAIAEHRTQHAKLAQDVARFKDRHDAGKAMIAVFLLNFLMAWLTDHALKSDKALARRIANR